MTGTENAKHYDLSQVRACVIVNPGSGRKLGEGIATRLQTLLSPRVAEFQIRRTNDGAKLAALATGAVDDGFDLILSIGGDGTQAAVAGALIDRDAAMAVIPAGTFNYFARDLGSGETVEQALKMFDAPALRAVDVGDMNGMIFLNNVSFGAYPEILKRRESIYARWGRSRVAAYWSAVAALWNLRKPLHVVVRADGEPERRFTTALAFVAKSAYQLESFGLEGADCVRRGQLALLVARARRPGPLIRSALRLAMGKSARYDDFNLVCADEMEIETVPAHEYVAHDGEKCWMDSPFRVRVRKGGLNVLVPAGSSGRDAP